MSTIALGIVLVIVTISLLAVIIIQAIVNKKIKEELEAVNRSLHVQNIQLSATVNIETLENVAYGTH